MWIWLLALCLVLLGAYFLFRDTLNKIQYVEHLRLYWITRDNGIDVAAYQPVLMRAFMRQTSPPFWQGAGYQLRVHKWTVQVGVLQCKVSEEDQLGSGWLDIPPDRLRKWERPDWNSDEATQ